MILIFRKVEPNISCLNVSRSDLFSIKPIFYISIKSTKTTTAEKIVPVF